MKIIALEEKLVKHLWLRTWNELKLPNTKVITTRISFTTLRTARTFNRNIMFTTGKSYSRKVEQYCHRKKKGRGLGRKKQWRNGCFMQMMMKMLLFMEVLQLKKHFHIHYDCWSSQKPYEIWLLFQFYKWVNRLKVLQLAHAILVIKYLIKFVVQSLRLVWLFATSWTVTRQAPLSSSISWKLLKATVLPMNIQGWFPLGLTGLIFLKSN